MKTSNGSSKSDPKVDKGKDLMNEDPIDKDDFKPINPCNRGRGQKRTLCDGQNDENFNRFDALDDLVQEEGIPMEISLGIKVAGEEENAFDGQEAHIVLLVVDQDKEMVIDLPSQSSNVTCPSRQMTSKGGDMRVNHTSNQSTKVVDSRKNGRAAQGILL